MAVHVLERPGRDVQVAVRLRMSDPVRTEGEWAGLVAGWSTALDDALPGAELRCASDCTVRVRLDPAEWPGALDVLAAALAHPRHVPRRVLARVGATAALVGPIPAAEAEQDLRSALGWLRGGPLANPAPASGPAAGLVVREGRPGLTRIRVAWTVPTDRAAWERVVWILAGGPGSRLYERVREHDGLAYAVESAPEGLSLEVRPEDSGRVYRAIEEELRRFTADGPTAEELDAAARAARLLHARSLAYDADLLLLDGGLGFVDPGNAAVSAAARGLDGPRSWTFEGEAERIRAALAEAGADVE